MWTSIWIGWLVFLVIADLIADRKPGATLSEHCRVWFRSTVARIILALFFLVLYLHFVVNLSVLPVVGLGAGVAFFIARKGKMNIRWDTWLGAVAFAGLTTLLTGGAAAFFSDGTVTRSELFIMVGMFLTGAGGWMKQHPEPPSVK